VLEEEITLRKVAVTAIIGCVVGCLIVGLAFAASPSFRGEAYWMAPMIVGACVVIALWIVFAPWWLSLAWLMPFDCG
jgi:uncharacterized membrane protein YeaQ/YmgE (transglycosylase-associated protein family)